MRFRLPRPRLTVRSTMILVAVAAVGLVFLIPTARGIVWLWRTPPGTMGNFRGSVLTHRVLPVRQAGVKIVDEDLRSLVGHPVAAVCTYECGILPAVPSGLPFRFTYKATLMDASKTPWAPVATKSGSTWLVSGVPGWDEDEGVFATLLNPPSAGYWAVRYEVEATDLFGRTQRVALHTGGFRAD